MLFTSFSAFSKSKGVVYYNCSLRHLKRIM